MKAMNFLIIFSVLTGVVTVTAQNQNSDKTPVEILTEKSLVNEDGYNFNFKTSDGTSRQEEGHLITVGEHQGIGITGSYSYLGPDGQQYLVSFTADEKGYKPSIRVLPPGGQ